MPRLELHHSHPWNLDPGEAVALQEQLAQHVQEVPLRAPPRTVAGIDVGVREEIARAALVILEFPDLVPTATATHEMPVPFPYVPGLLSFREVPVILKVLETLPSLPEVLICDGQGRAHPRRFGLASHLGVLLDHPTVGCAKSRLVGHYTSLAERRGAWVPLTDNGEVIGAVVRTRTGVKPVFVSVGHRVTLEDAIQLVLQMSPRYRIPVPLRWAHRLSRGEPVPIHPSPSRLL